MRKLISLGLLALMASMFSGAVFAGNVEECEFLADGDYSKGLYGLCIAYHNAGNESARERILENYAKKAGPGDPPLPGAGESCLCWDADQLAAASLNGTPSACLLVTEGQVADAAIYTATGGLYQFRSDAFGCIRVDPDSSGAFEIYNDDVEWATCVAGILTLIKDDFDGIECNGIPQ